MSPFLVFQCKCLVSSKVNFGMKCKLLIFFFLLKACQPNKLGEFYWQHFLELSKPPARKKKEHRRGSQSWTAQGREGGEQSIPSSYLTRRGGFEVSERAHMCHHSLHWAGGVPLHSDAPEAPHDWRKIKKKWICKPSETHHQPVIEVVCFVFLIKRNHVKCYGGNRTFPVNSPWVVFLQTRHLKQWKTKHCFTLSAFLL